MLKLSPSNAFTVAAGLVLAGLVLAMVVSLSTLDQWPIGIAWPLLLSACAAVIALVPVLILRVVISSLVRRRWWPKWLEYRVILSAGLALSVLIAGTAIYSATPRQRYLQIVGAAGEAASDITVTGLSSFLATRWLVSFKIAPEKLNPIIARWNLREVGPISLRERLHSDTVLGSSNSRVLQNMPGPEGTRCFVTATDQELDSSSWITFVVRESDQRAWFYRGYQN